MNLFELLTLVATGGLVVYLFVAMLFPERFT